ncbi:MAG TPA: GDP-mannose 4,6-dehydratase [Dehalococcoidia bacterium]|nr:GDP-mannose 4,6-dehydratase [Dehalococcoidia bacterium]
MNIKNKNVLITGVSGFVGSRLAKYLLDKGANVYGLFRVRADGNIPYNIKFMGIEKDIHLIDSDVTDISSVSSALTTGKPEYIFHLAAQSFVAQSFIEPCVTMEVNCNGTLNLLEAARKGGFDTKIIFAGSSEEYGLVIYSEAQYKHIKEKYGEIFPNPVAIPEVPIKETNPLRPVSPYAVSKVYGDFLMRNYYLTYGLKTIVSRAFNHEGAGRGKVFVTTLITDQVAQLKRGEIDHITIGNINAFRDWSHIHDMLRGYCLLAEKGKFGEVYNQGSRRTNSVLSYILLSLEEAGYTINKIQTNNGKKIVENPTEPDNSVMFGYSFLKTKVDRLILEGKLEYELKDEGIQVITNKGTLKVQFDKDRFRPSDVPILLSDTAKIEEIGFTIKHSLKDIIKDQLDYCEDCKI